MTVARGMALHKMIRLVTASTINGGYLNFMGNEFGHPEWIDFPREGNGWSYKYARRQWDLVDRKELKYSYLNDFDNAMISLISGVYNFQDLPVTKLWEKDDDQILAYRRGDFVFVYNFNPFKSFSDYGILTPPGEYQVVLSSDSPLYGGYGNIDETVHHFTIPDPLFEPHGVAWLRLYMPARSAQVLKLVAGSGKKVSKASSSKMSEETKRKPGRPKKADPEAEAPAAKRKPGRPRKTDPEAEAPAVKRRPGRPKKSEAEKPAGRKPGRPKKEE